MVKQSNCLPAFSNKIFYLFLIDFIYIYIKPRTEVQKNAYLDQTIQNMCKFSAKKYGRLKIRLRVPKREA